MIGLLMHATYLPIQCATSNLFIVVEATPLMYIGTNIQIKAIISSPVSVGTTTFKELLSDNTTSILGEAIPTDGVATINYTTPTVGVHTILAVYSNPANNVTIISPLINVTALPMNVIDLLNQVSILQSQNMDLTNQLRDAQEQVFLLTQHTTDLNLKLDLLTTNLTILQAENSNLTQTVRTLVNVTVSLASQVEAFRDAASSSLQLVDVLLVALVALGLVLTYVFYNYVLRPKPAVPLMKSLNCSYQTPIMHS